MCELSRVETASAFANDSWKRSLIVNTGKSFWHKVHSAAACGNSCEVHEAATRFDRIPAAATVEESTFTIATINPRVSAEH